MDPYEYIARASDAEVRQLAEWHPHPEDASEEAHLSRAARLAVQSGHRPAISRAWGREAARIDAGYFDARDPWQRELWISAARRDHGDAYAEGYREGLPPARSR